MDEFSILSIGIGIACIFFAVWFWLVDRENHKEAPTSMIDEIIDKNNLEIKAKLLNKIQEYEHCIKQKDNYIRKKETEYYDLEKKLDKASFDLFMSYDEINDLKTQVLNLTNLNQSLQKELLSFKTSSIQISVKKCPACRRVQPLSEFGKNEHQPDGLTKWCSLCMSEGAPMPHDISGMKICEKCGQNRKKSSFYPSSRYADGLSKWCKFCLDNKK
ncbi:TPA: hypothetical protein ACPI21_000770 [Haemophilus influenzae]|uniref:hypothetical protein n=1 Tax=Haemophilus influenzae TaxID=727 RepID=UPI001F16DC3E|nr:hypothetical protein [Haemophilus influenzae]MCK8911120.1 hypothetical protein [Haemophilus influenzae]MCK9089588.1 hypothetical protein [Haemophilus influenzae]